jgi:hypothetical protein
MNVADVMHAVRNVLVNAVCNVLMNVVATAVKTADDTVRVFTAMNFEHVFCESVEDNGLVKV